MRPGTHSRRSRLGSTPDASLDELLSEEDGPGSGDAAPPDPAGPPPWRLRAIGQAFAISAVVYTGFRAFGYAAPYLLVAAVSAAAVLVRRAVVVASESGVIRASVLVPAPHAIVPISADGWYEGGDGMLNAVHRWDRRLDWGASAPERFTYTMLGRLGDLVDERLRQRHGITRSSDPVRARGLLGEELWSFLHEPATHVPTPPQVAAAVSQMEKL